MSSGLHAPLTRASAHLCIDMQRLFSSDGPWETPWMERVLPKVEMLAGRFPERTIFTRFITPRRPEDMPGAWRAYYERWRQTTREAMDPALLDLMPQLARWAPPAAVIDKPVYSAFAVAATHELLRERGVDTLIVTGAETDMCVLATVLAAVDLGYRVVLVTDCVCSSSDATHDALLTLYRRRFSFQIEAATCEEVLEAWR